MAELYALICIHRILITFEPLTVTKSNENWAARND